MRIEKRIENLEERTGGKRQVVIVVVRAEEVDGRRQVHPRDYTQKEYDQALASYKAKNPDQKEGDFIVLHWEDGQFREPYNKRS